MYNANISIHSLRMEGDGRYPHEYANYGTFQSTPSAWRETVNSPWRLASHESFQSTPSAWRETSFPDRPGAATQHFNPLPPHGGRRDNY